MAIGVHAREECPWFSQASRGSARSLMRRTIRGQRQNSLCRAGKLRPELRARPGVIFNPHAPEPINDSAGSAMDACEDAALQQKERIAYYARRNPRFR